MKKASKIFFLSLVAAFVIVQFFGIERTNPAIVAADAMEAVLTVPADISLILGRSCNDCHSHKTIYPWYSNIQPGGWFLRDHVDDGRRHLNFSLYATYSPKKQAHKLEEICEQMEALEMPLPSYLWLHSDAALSESDRKALCDWANTEKGKIIL